MISKLIKNSKLLIPIFLVMTAIFGTIYSVAQQSYRQTANDPQIQLAEEEVVQLESGKKADNLNTLAKTDLSKNLTPFLIVFDSKGNPVGSTAILNGRIPVPPQGVFAVAEARGENNVTWQPADNVRIAAVIRPVHGQNPGYVLAGKSLREVEKREGTLSLQVGAGYIVSLIVAGATVLLLL